MAQRGMQERMMHTATSLPPSPTVPHLLEETVLRYFISWACRQKAGAHRVDLRRGMMCDTRPHMLNFQSHH